MTSGTDDSPTHEPPRDGTARPTAAQLVLAPRPMFFTASILPVGLGTAWGVRVAGDLEISAFLLALAAIVCVHGAVNVLNDVYDDICGTDPINTGRISPFTGGSRVIQDGILDRRAMARLGLVLLAAAGLCGLALAVLMGPVVIALGVIGAGLGVAYSATPIQLSARGLGELAVGIGFGVLPVMGAAWQQSGVFGSAAFLISLPPSLWVLNILLINEIPDIDADAAVGKRTLPVRWGLRGTWPLYVATNMLAFLAIVLAVAQGLLPALALIGPGALLAVAGYVAWTLARGAPDRPSLTAAIKATLAIHALGTMWLIVFAWP